MDPPAKLSTHGFELITHARLVELDLQSTETVQAEWYAECRALIRRATGCDEVRGGSHEYRRPPGLPTPNSSGGGYAGGIHADMSPGIERGWVQGRDDDCHFESLNVWRSAEPLHDIEMMPLCLCDMRTVTSADVVFGDGQNTSDIRQHTKLVDERCVHSPVRS